MNEMIIKEIAKDLNITEKQVNVVLNNYSFEYDGDAHVYVRS